MNKIATALFLAYTTAVILFFLLFATTLHHAYEKKIALILIVGQLFVSLWFYATRKKS